MIHIQPKVADSARYDPIFGRQEEEGWMKIQRRSPDPFFYPGNETGILLIHGFTGTPSELRPMGKNLSERGYTVYAPLLAGHGTSPEEMDKTTWQDWWVSTLQAYEKMKKEGAEKVVAVGLSMGGTLALNLARTKPLTGVVSLCSPIRIQDRKAPLADWVSPIMPYLKRRGTKPAHIEEHLVPYDRTPLRCVSSLRKLIRHVKRHLPEIEVPALIVQAVKDETVVPSSASLIYEKISSQDKTIRWYEKSSHIITLDKEREKLFEEVAKFVQRVSVPAEISGKVPEGKGDSL